MRKYEIYYYAEINDECVDLICQVEAKNMIQALVDFDYAKVYKRVYKVVEVNNIIDF